MSDLNAFDDAQIERLRKLLDAFEAGRLDRPQVPPRVQLSGPLWTNLGLLTSDVTAAAGDVPGQGTARLIGTEVTPGLSTIDPDTYELVSQISAAVDFDPDPSDETVLNLGGGTFAAGAYVLLCRDPISGLYYVAAAAASVAASSFAAYHDFLPSADAPVLADGTETELAPVTLCSSLVIERSGIYVFLARMQWSIAGGITATVTDSQEIWLRFHDGTGTFDTAYFPIVNEPLSLTFEHWSKFAGVANYQRVFTVADADVPATVSSQITTGPSNEYSTDGAPASNPVSIEDFGVVAIRIGDAPA